MVAYVICAFNFMFLVVACKSYFVALVLLSLRFVYDVK